MSCPSIESADPTHEEFLAGYELSQAQLARALAISPNRIAEIVHNRRRVSADSALRLGLYFGTTPEFWMNLQAHYDLELARRALGPETAERTPPSGSRSGRVEEFTVPGSSEVQIL